MDTVLIRIMTIPVLALLFFILPVRVQEKTLLRWAFLFWITGGIMLTFFGIQRFIGIYQADHLLFLGAGLIVAVILGVSKGKFILTKTAKRNIARIHQLDGPQKLIHVYSPRSWIVIGLMLLISAALTFFNADMFIRGIVNLAVGLALITSSLHYLHACCPLSSSSSPS